MITTRSAIVLLAMASFMSAQTGLEREIAPLQNWPTPLYWHPTEAEARDTLAGSDAPRMRSNATATLTNPPVGSTALVFVAMTPCRIVDTRTSAGFTGAFGAPHLNGGASRTFPIPTSTTCSIPSLAKAYSFNVTVVPPGPLGFLTMYPAGQSLPLAATLNALQGQVVANAAIVPAGTSGSVNVFASNNTELVIDINGYYATPTDSNNNTALGASALASNTTGGQNTGIGFSALTSNTTGAQNTASGYSALASNKDGSYNTANGFAALSLNTSGFENTAIGNSALRLNTTGFDNTAIGQDALLMNIDGNGSAAVGVRALRNNTSGYNNIAVGKEALFMNSGGAGNTAAGFQALHGNTTGILNAAFGADALQLNATGNSNIALGSSAGFNVLHDNNIEIGNGGTSADNNTIRIGDIFIHTSFFAGGVRGVTTGVADAVPVFIDSQGQLGTANSSRRFKEDIIDMGDASSGLLRLRPVTFRYKKAYSDGSKPLDYGLIAEEVAEVYPDLVVRGADGQIETVQYQKLAPMLLNELQKQQETIRSLEQRLASLEALLTAKTVDIGQ